MKCPEVKHWLYGLKPRSTWPVELVRHLQKCPRCLKLRSRLAALDLAVLETTKASVGEAAKAKVAAKIQRLPQMQSPKPTNPAPRWTRWARGVAFLAGAAALIAFGMFLGPQEPPSVETRTVEVVREKVTRVPYSSDSVLLPVLLKRNVQLVRARTPAEQFRVLHAMAEDCRAHAVLLMREGPADNLSLVVGLYDRLLLEGVADQSQRVPLEQREAVFEPILAQLQQSADEDPLPASLPPGPVRDFLHEMQSADRQTAALLKRAVAMNVERPQRPPHPSAAATPALLVAMALNSCSQPDPLARAQSCADHVHQLMPSLLVRLVDAQAPAEDEVGSLLGELMRDGVYSPLEATSGKPAANKEQIERVRKRADQAVAVLEKNLQRAPVAAREGLEKALSRSGKGNGWDTKGWDTKKGKGWEGKKGPAWKNDAAKPAPKSKVSFAAPRDAILTSELACAIPYKTIQPSHTLASSPATRSERYWLMRHGNS